MTATASVRDGTRLTTRTAPTLPRTGPTEPTPPRALSAPDGDAVPSSGPSSRSAYWSGGVDGDGDEVGCGAGSPPDSAASSSATSRTTRSSSDSSS